MLLSRRTKAGLASVALVGTLGAAALVAGGSMNSAEEAELSSAEIVALRFPEDLVDAASPAAASGAAAAGDAASTRSSGNRRATISADESSASSAEFMLPPATRAAAPSVPTSATDASPAFVLLESSMLHPFARPGNYSQTGLNLWLTKGH